MANSDTTFFEWWKQTDAEVDNFAADLKYDARYQAWKRDRGIDRRRRALRARWNWSFRARFVWIGFGCVALAAFICGRWLR